MNTSKRLHFFVIVNGARQERVGQHREKNICTCSSQMLGNGLQPFSCAIMTLLRQDPPVFTGVSVTVANCWLYIFFAPPRQQNDRCVHGLMNRNKICRNDDRSQQFARKATDKNQQLQALNMTISKLKQDQLSTSPYEHRSENARADILCLLKANR